VKHLQKKISSLEAL